MTTKEKIERDLDDLPSALLEQIYQFIKSVRSRNSNKKEVRSFKLGGQFDELNIRQRAYE